MAEVSQLKDFIKNRFHNLSQIEEGVYQAQLLHEDKPYSDFTFDLRDDVIALSQHIKAFQESIVGPDYFNKSDHLRWNSYLFVYAGNKSLLNDSFNRAKFTIESNKDYTRKFVVTESEFFSHLQGLTFANNNQVNFPTDVMSRWRTHLADHNINILLQKPSRTLAIRKIEAGEANVAISLTNKNILNSDAEFLTDGLLKNIQIQQFRPVHNQKNYSFSKVNLIVGPNGTGKTSLLEAIEYLYCGSNRRSNTTGNIEIIGEWYDQSTESTKAISATIDTSVIKSRSYTWYKKEIHKRSEIVSSFTKYNFLDTDAAFRIAEDLEPSQLKDDLSKLIVGEDASTLWDYILKLKEEIPSRIAEVSRLIRDLNQKITFNTQELGQLKSAPTDSSSLIKTFLSSLNRVGWKLNENDQDIRLSSEVRVDLELVLERLSRINSLVQTTLTALEIQNEYVVFIDLYNKKDLILEELEVQRSGLETIQLKIEDEKEQIEKLTEWLDYLNANFPERVESFDKSEQLINTLKQQLSSASAALTTKVDVKYSGISLEMAATRIAADLQELRELMSVSLATQEDIQSKNQTISLLKRQLQDTVKTLRESSDDKSKCPVCNTNFDPNELTILIESLGEDLETSPVIESLAKIINKNTQAELYLIKCKQDIAELKSIALSLGYDPMVVTSNEINESIVFKQNSLAEHINNFERVSDYFSNMESNGLSLNRYYELKEEVANNSLSEDDIENLDSMKERTRHVDESLKKYLKIASEYNEKIASLTKQFFDLIRSSRLNIFNYEKESSLDDINLKLEEDYGILIRTVSDIDIVSRQLKFDDKTPFSALIEAIVSLLHQFDNAFYALNLETTSSVKELELTEELEKINTELNDVKKKHERLTYSLNALEGLIKNYSINSATSEILNAISLGINEIFGRIHTPKEYKFSGDANNLMVTIDGNHTKSLEQISTGQRAAFALSIFLALNLTAKTAPPIVLIDDPIAHIDDLNALSFLDYLRDLVLNSNRQIFFATADTKVAALFEKKFSFLGELGFNKIELLPRYN